MPEGSGGLYLLKIRAMLNGKNPRLLLLEQSDGGCQLSQEIVSNQIQHNHVQGIEGVGEILNEFAARAFFSLIQPYGNQ